MAANLQGTHPAATIDGEAVCCGEASIAVFDKLHSRFHDSEAFLYAFDLLELDGEDWRPRRLEERKNRVQKLIAKPQRIRGHWVARSAS